MPVTSFAGTFLLPDLARTAGSVPKIPIPVYQESVSNKGVNSQYVEEYMQTALFIWNSLAKSRQHHLEALDCSFRDILR